MHKVHATAVTAFPRVRRVIFQELRMPDDSWNPKGLDIALRRPVEIFIPNVCAVDMDTTGTWPFGRRLEDQVATRFLSLFLDMEGTVAGRPVHIETLNDQALWDSCPGGAEDAAQPAAQRQGVPGRLPLSRRAVVTVADAGGGTAAVAYGTGLKSRL